MNGIGARYGLAAPTVAALADIKGPNLDPDSPEAWEAAAAAAGVPGGVIAPPAAGQAASPNPLARSNPYSPPAVAAGVGPDRPELAPKGPAPDVQGPAKQDFPTVRSMDSSGVGPGAAPLPVRAVPAHWQPGSHAVALQHGMDPRELEASQYYRDEAAGHGIQAADKRLEAAQTAGMADAVYAASHAAASKRANDQIAALNQQRDQYVQQESRKLDQLASQAQAKVDPEAYWKEKGSGARVAAALMIGLNQFATTWRGKGTNTAMQIINQEVDRNIAAQQTNIANAGKALDLRQNLYARNLQTFGDKERAVLATKINYLDQVAAQANQHKALAGQANAEAANQELLKNIALERAQAADNFAKLTHTQATEQMNEHFVPTQYVGGGGGQKGKDALYVPTLGGYARDENSAQKLNQKGALRMQITENMRKVHDLMEQSKGLSSLNPAEAVKLKQIDDQIAMYVDDTLTKNTVLEGQGAMSAADKAVAEQAKGLKGASVQFKPNMVIEKRQQTIKAAAEGVLEQHRLEGEAYGIQKGSEQYRQGPAGPEPVRVLQGRNATPSKNTQGYDDLVVGPQGVPQQRK